MKKVLDLIIIIPLGILMSGPFAIWGTIGGFVSGIVVGYFLFGP